jgi:hypothetical protein
MNKLKNMMNINKKRFIIQLKIFSKTLPKKLILTNICLCKILIMIISQLKEEKD